MQWRSPLCSAPKPHLLVGDGAEGHLLRPNPTPNPLCPGVYLLVGDGAEGHLVEVDVGLAQLLLHHLLRVDQRDEGGHLVRVKGEG